MAWDLGEGVYNIIILYMTLHGLRAYWRGGEPFDLVYQDPGKKTNANSFSCRYL